MPEEPASTPPAQPETKGDEGKGTVPSKTEAPTSQAIDLSKVGDEDFAKVFEDPRLYNHPRFKSLNERAKKAQEYEEAEETRKQDELKQKGEWEKVAKQNEDKAKAAEQRYQQSLADNRIQSEAVKLGAVDLEAVLKLIDRNTIKIAEDGTITGVEDAVKALLDSKPYLKGSGTQPIVGGGTAPGGSPQDGLKRFKLSQIQNPEFYRQNEQDILASVKANMVEDDLQR